MTTYVIVYTQYLSKRWLPLFRFRCGRRRGQRDAAPTQSAGPTPDASFVRPANRVKLRIALRFFCSSVHWPLGACGGHAASALASHTLVSHVLVSFGRGLPVDGYEQGRSHGRGTVGRCAAARLARICSSIQRRCSGQRPFVLRCDGVNREETGDVT